MSSVHFKDFFISADDWGLSPAVNQGILELAKLGILRRASLMARQKFLKEKLSELQQISDVSLGLHFNLTFENNFRSPAHLLLSWTLADRSKRLQLQDKVRAELIQQIQLLNAAGVQPKHFDGHHHIHIVPGLFASIADILINAGIKEVRVPYDPYLWKSMKAPLNFFARKLAKDPLIQNFKVLPFRYPGANIFTSKEKLKKYLMNERSKGAEILIHPASENDFKKYGIVDSVTYTRVTEFQALKNLI